MKHKFINKGNGKVASVLVMYLDDEGHMQTDSYDKVEDLLADYAAYERAPKEPLIKDEKIRKAVRAWAEANGLKIIYFQYHNDLLYMSFSDPDADYMSSIFFDGDKFNVKEYSESLQGNTLYTIAELCGEEEE